ncbi:hypothetical protein QEN19_003902 [Hanseniaspora menglaensis]
MTTMKNSVSGFNVKILPLTTKNCSLQKKKNLNQSFTSFWLYVKYFIFVLLEPLIKLAQLVSDSIIVFKLIFLGFNNESTYFKPWVPFKVSKWIYISTNIVILIMVIYKTTQSLILIKYSDNIILIYFNTFAKKIFTIKKGIPAYVLFIKIQETTSSKLEQSNFNRLCFFAWEQLHNWQFLILNGPKQVINSLTLWSFFVSRNQKNLNDLSSWSSFLIKLRAIKYYSQKEATVLVGMLVSLMLYALLAFVFCFGVASLIYIESQLLSTNSDFQHRWIPFFREEQSSLKKYIALQLYANLEKESESKHSEYDLSPFHYYKKYWIETENENKILPPPYIKTPSKSYKYV